jgi:hypothetical protein
MQPFLEIRFLWKTHETRPDTHMGGVLHMDRPYLAWVRACRAPAAAALSAALLSQSSVAETANPAAAGAHSALPLMRTAQLPRYTASGRHQCGSGNDPKRSCVVTGLFSDCNDATSTLKARDCCPTTAGGGTSSAFYLTYCIPDLSGR